MFKRWCLLLRKRDQNTIRRKHSAGNILLNLKFRWFVEVWCKQLYRVLQWPSCYCSPASLLMQSDVTHRTANYEDHYRLYRERSSGWLSENMELMTIITNIKMSLILSISLILSWMMLPSPILSLRNAVATSFLFNRNLIKIFAPSIKFRVLINDRIGRKKEPRLCFLLHFVLVHVNLKIFIIFKHSLCSLDWQNEVIQS